MNFVAIIKMCTSFCFILNFKKYSSNLSFDKDLQLRGDFVIVDIKTYQNTIDMFIMFDIKTGQ